MRKDFLEPLDLTAFREFLDCLDSKEKTEGQVFLALLESRVTKGFPVAPVNLALLVSQDRLDPLGPMVFPVSKENSESLDFLVSQHLKRAEETEENQEGQDFRDRRVSLEMTVFQASRDPRGPLEIRAWTEFLVHPEDLAPRGTPEALGFLDQRVLRPSIYTPVRRESQVILAFKDYPEFRDRREKREIQANLVTTDPRAMPVSRQWAPRDNRATKDSRDLQA